MMALERLCPVNSISSMFLSYLREKLIFEPNFDPNQTWATISDSRVTFLGQYVKKVLFFPLVELLS
jgi:hypothetical protein